MVHEMYRLAVNLYGLAKWAEIQRFWRDQTAQFMR
jgi:hypothetical protein